MLIPLNSIGLHVLEFFEFVFVTFGANCLKAIFRFVDSLQCINQESCVSNESQAELFYYVSLFIINTCYAFVFPHSKIDTATPPKLLVFFVGIKTFFN